MIAGRNSVRPDVFVRYSYLLDRIVKYRVQTLYIALDFVRLRYSEAGLKISEAGASVLSRCSLNKIISIGNYANFVYIF